MWKRFQKERMDKRRGECMSVQVNGINFDQNMQ